MKHILLATKSRLQESAVKLPVGDIPGKIYKCARGAYFYSNTSDMPVSEALALYERFFNGTAYEKDFHSMLAPPNSVGIWWLREGTEDNNSFDGIVSGAREHASFGEDVTSKLAQYVYRQVKSGEEDSLDEICVLY